MLDIFGVEQHGEHFIMEPLFNNMPDVVSISAASAIVCEGSGLDFRAIRRRLPCAVVSASGKDKVVFVVRNTQPIEAIVVDWCGTGGATSEIIRICEELEISYFYSPSLSMSSSLINGSVETAV